MAGWEGRVSGHRDLEHRQLHSRAVGGKGVAVAPTVAADPTPRRTLELADYVQMPITGELGGEPTRGQLARVNVMRDEPGGRRFFVNDLNGPLYILDKQSKQFTTYLDFNGVAGRPGLFQKLTFERNFATGLISFLFDPDYRATASSTRSTWRTRPPRRRPSRSRASSPDSTCQATGPPRPSRRRSPGAVITPRSRDDRVDRPQHHEHDVRRHGARAAADAAGVAHSSAR